MTSILAQGAARRQGTSPSNAIAPGPNGDQALPRRQAAGRWIERLAKLAPLETSRPAPGYRPTRVAFLAGPGRRLGSTARRCAPMAGASDPASPSNFNNADNGDSIMSEKIILITGASKRLRPPPDGRSARQGRENTVYASMARPIAGPATPKNAAEMAEDPRSAMGVDPARGSSSDVQSEPSIDVAVKKIMAESGKIDVAGPQCGSHDVWARARGVSCPSNSRCSTTSTCSARRRRQPGPSCRTCAPAKQGSASLDLEQQLRLAERRPISRPYFRGQSGDGTRWPSSMARELSRWGHRDDDRRAGGAFTKGHEPLSRHSGASG